MKRLTLASILMIGLSTPVLYAHGSEKHMKNDGTKMSSVVGKNNSRISSPMNMDPKFRAKMMKTMQSKIITIVKDEMKKNLNESMSATMELSIRDRLQSAMQEMSKKTMAKMQGKASNGMMGKGGEKQGMKRQKIMNKGAKM